MADLHKTHGARAIGVVAQEAGGAWRATLTLRGQKHEDIHGPAYFDSEHAAREWVAHEAARHGFGADDLELMVQPLGG